MESPLQVVKLFIFDTRPTSVGPEMEAGGISVGRPPPRPMEAQPPGTYGAAGVRFLSIDSNTRRAAVITIPPEEVLYVADSSLYPPPSLCDASSSDDTFILLLGLLRDQTVSPGELPCDPVDAFAPAGDSPGPRYFSAPPIQPRLQ